MGLFSSDSYNIDFVVDTEPMARSVDQVSDDVQETTGAVVAMQSAVIGAEIQSRKDICNSVNTGFYSLISSQLSQKLATYESEMSSSLGLMTVLSKKITATQTTATRDYNRIKSRYIQLFNGLDESLKNRIFEVNKAAMEIAEVRNATNKRCVSEEVRPMLMFQNVSDTSSKMLSGEIRKYSIQTITSLYEKLKAEIVNEENVDSVKFDLNVEGDTFIPVVVTERSELGVESDSWQAYIPQMNIDVKQQLTQAAIEYSRSSQWAVKDNKDIWETVKNNPDFETLDSRVATQIQKLLKSDFESLEG